MTRWRPYAASASHDPAPRQHQTPSEFAAFFFFLTKADNFGLYYSPKIDFFFTKYCYTIVTFRKLNSHCEFVIWQLRIHLLPVLAHCVFCA